MHLHCLVLLVPALAAMETHERLTPAAHQPGSRKQPTFCAQMLLREGCASLMQESYKTHKGHAREAKERADQEALAAQQQVATKAVLPPRAAVLGPLEPDPSVVATAAQQVRAHNASPGAAFIALPARSPSVAVTKAVNGSAQERAHALPMVPNAARGADGQSGGYLRSMMGGTPKTFLLFAMLVLVALLAFFRAMVGMISIRWGRSKERLPMLRLHQGAASKPGGPSGAPVAGLRLCPELVVPEGKECTLLVPRLPADSTGPGRWPTVEDSQGRPVMRATFLLAAPAAGRSPKIGEVKRLILSSAIGDAVYAFCRDSPAEAGCGPAGLRLYHRSEAPFGVLHADGCEAGSGYSVVTEEGCRVYFRVDLQGGSLTATDEQGRLLAIAEPAGVERHSVRIRPGVDAGLITITLLSIGILEHRSRNPMEAVRAASTF